MANLSHNELVSKVFPSGRAAALYCIRCGSCSLIDDWQRILEGATEHVFTPAAAWNVVAHASAHAHHGIMLVRVDPLNLPTLFQKATGYCIHADGTCRLLAYARSKGMPLCAYHFLTELDQRQIMIRACVQARMNVQGAFFQGDARAWALDVVRVALDELGEDLAMTVSERVLTATRAAARAEIVRVEEARHG